MQISIIIVHLNTPRLLGNLINSIQKHLKSVLIQEILVVDNASSSENLRLINHIQGIRVLYQKRNLHHGPGMDLGIRRAVSDTVLILDSDTFFYRTMLFDQIFPFLRKKAFSVSGALTHVNESGYDVEYGKGIPYLHPSFLILNKKFYLEASPFIKGGAPCLAFFKKIYSDQIKIFPVEYSREEKNYCSPIYESLFHIGKGSRSPWKKRFLHEKCIRWNHGFNVNEKLILQNIGNL